MKKTRFLLLFASAAVLTAFNLTAQDAKKEDAAADAGTLLAGEFTFKYGKPWERMEVSSSMRAGRALRSPPRNCRVCEPSRSVPAPCVPARSTSR